MRRAGLALATAFVLLGVFFVGRESSHGLGAFYEHWWCPTPLVVIVLGMATILTIHRLNSTAT